MGIGHGRCESVEKFVCRGVGVDSASSHTAGHQETSALVDQGRGNMRATYLQCPDQLKRLRHGAPSHRTYAFTTRTRLGTQVFIVPAPTAARTSGAAGVSFLFILLPSKCVVFLSPRAHIESVPRRAATLSRKAPVSSVCMGVGVGVDTRFRP